MGEGQGGWRGRARVLVRGPWAASRTCSGVPRPAKRSSSALMGTRVSFGEGACGTVAILPQPQCQGIRSLLGAFTQQSVVKGGWGVEGGGKRF